MVYIIKSYQTLPEKGGGNGLKQGVKWRESPKKDR